MTTKNDRVYSSCRANINIYYNAHVLKESKQKKKKLKKINKLKEA